MTRDRPEGVTRRLWAFVTTPVLDDEEQEVLREMIDDVHEVMFRG